MKRNHDIRISQRDAAAILILLIFITAAVIMLISGTRRYSGITVPAEEIRIEIENKAELKDETLKSEHLGISYEKKLKAIEERKKKEQELKEKLTARIKRTKSLVYIPAAPEKIAKSQEYKSVCDAFSWNGAVINKSNGSVRGPNGKETYYNLPMKGVVAIMRGMGNRDKYWVRSDGCKMLGNYIMVAANFRRHPCGSIVKCSRGYAIVCDTGTFAKKNPDQLDIAVTW